jgi:hypothetical protein
MREQGLAVAISRAAEPCAVEVWGQGGEEIGEKGKYKHGTHFQPQAATDSCSTDEQNFATSAERPDSVSVLAS